MSNDKIKNMSFEDALKELQVVVKRLETGETTLDNSIKDYEYGMALKKYCESKLAEAKMKVEKVVEKPDGSMEKLPLDVE